MSSHAIFFQYTKSFLFKVFLEVNNVTEQITLMTDTSVRNFGEICETLFNEIGAKKTTYFKLISERYYHMI